MENLKKPIALFIIGIILGISIMAVFAGSADSPEICYGPHLGYSYCAYSSIYLSGSSGVFGSSRVRSDNFKNVPIGYMGVMADLTRESDGALIATSTWRYNTEPIASMGVTTDYVTTKGTYYSQGLSRAYNGNGYDTYLLYRSPSQTY